MMFEKTTLGEMSLNGKGSYGIAASAVPYSDELFTYLRITDINDDGTLNKSGLMSVSDEKADQYLLKPNDIVFARTGGSTGRNYFYDGTDGEFVYAGFLIKFSIDDTKVNPRFIKYYCLSQEYKGWVHSFNTGSTRGNINAQTYANMPILLPSREQQDFLVDTLSVLDEKIKLNTAINENLEQQAQALFKAWFVDYEPFGESKPDSWQDISVYDLADYINGAAFKKAEYGDYGLPIIKIAELKSGITDSTQYCCVSKDDKYYINDKDILFSWSGNPDTSIDTFLWSRGEAILNQHTFRVVSKYNAPAFTYFLLKYLKPQFTHIASNKQTTGLGHVTVADLKRLQFSTNDTAIADFESLTAPIFDALFSISKENQRLAALRDTLLPKLMNGEIDVSEVKI